MSSEDRADVFNVGRWHAKCITTIGSYNVLVSLAETPGALEALKGSKRVIGLRGELSADERGSIEVRALLDAYCAEVGRAVEHYASMMIVAGATLMENMLIEFFVACFCAKPRAMHAYLQKTSERGMTLSLNEVLAATDMRDFHAKLALRAAKAAINGSAARVLDRASAVTGFPAPPSLSIRVESVTTRRNKVVHDAVTYFRRDGEVAEVFDVALDLLRQLALACRHAEVPYQDPGLLIDDWPIPDDPA